MVSAKINFAFMKQLAQTKVALLRRAHPSAEVKKMITRLNQSITLLDDCGGMGFNVTFASKRAMAGVARVRKGKARSKRG